MTCTPLSSGQRDLQQPQNQIDQTICRWEDEDRVGSTSPLEPNSATQQYGIRPMRAASIDRVIITHGDCRNSETENKDPEVSATLDYRYSCGWTNYTTETLKQRKVIYKCLSLTHTQAVMRMGWFKSLECAYSSFHIQCDDQKHLLNTTGNSAEERLITWMGKWAWDRRDKCLCINQSSSRTPETNATREVSSAPV